MYLAIEGVIGVGKTSLARLLQPTFNAELLLEVFEENPFLSDFYSDRARYALQTELFFLLSRYHQQKDVPAMVERGPVIADFTFTKSALFASRNLSGDEWALYERLNDALAEKVLVPDLMVYLQAPTETLMERIAKRGRAYERNMEWDYIDELGHAYDEFFANYRAGPVLIVDAAPLNFIDDPGDLKLVAERIRVMLGFSEYQASLPLPAIDESVQSDPPSVESVDRG
ncbi:MAG: deoxynucleoside kinase [Anaerolineales bacterium]